MEPGGPISAVVPLRAPFDLSALPSAVGVCAEMARPVMVEVVYRKFAESPGRGRRRSMTTQELVRRTLLDEHGDFLKDAVAMVAAQLMDAEITAQIGAGHGEVCAGRVTHRNGYRPRGWETRVGEIQLQIPKKRSGESYFPSFLGSPDVSVGR